MIEHRPISFTVADDPSPLRIDGDGVVRVGPTRVTLDTVIGSYWDGASAEDIVSWYDTLDLADVYAVIGYYLRHRSEVDRYLAEREKEAERIRRAIEASFDPKEFRERLLKRHEARRQRGDASIPG